MATPKYNKNTHKYSVQVYIGRDENEKRIYKRFTADSKKEVESLAAAYKREVEKQAKVSRKITLREACEKYLSYLESKKSSVSPSTVRSYYSLVKNHFQSLMDTDIMSITDSMLQNEIYALEEKVSAKTIANIVNFFVPAIKHFRQGYEPKLTLPKKQKPKTKVPDNDKLYEDLKSLEGKRLYIPVVLAAFCGMRRSEIAALDLKTDVEFNTEIEIAGEKHRICVIHINKAMVQDKNENWVLKSTKTEAGTRNVFAADWINDLLMSASEDPEYKMYKPGEMSARFASWAKQRGIECSFHGLRHYFASIVKALNIPDNYAMKIIGHSSDYMLKHYQEIMDEKNVEVNETLLTFIEKMQPKYATAVPTHRENESKSHENERKREF